MTGARQVKTDQYSRPAQATILGCAGAGLVLTLEQNPPVVRAPAWLFAGQRLQEDAWRHLALVVAGNVQGAYLDGRLLNEQTLAARWRWTHTGGWGRGCVDGWPLPAFGRRLWMAPAFLRGALTCWIRPTLKPYWPPGGLTNRATP